MCNRMQNPKINIVFACLPFFILNVTAEILHVIAVYADMPSV
jgi:hypothetical protein